MIDPEESLQRAMELWQKTLAMQGDVFAIAKAIDETLAGDDGNYVLGTAYTLMLAAAWPAMVRVFHETGLTPEEADAAINAAMQQEVLRMTGDLFRLDVTPEEAALG